MNQVARLLAGLLLIAASVGASAQVHRCTDAAGKIHYSDKPCAFTGQTGQQIERKLTPAEIRAQREQDFEAQVRKQNRLQAEQERELESQQQRHMQGQSVPIQQAPTSDWQRRKDQQNAQTSSSSITNNGGRFDQSAEIQRARARQDAARREEERNPTIASCSGSVCFDTLGNTYHRTGPNSLMGANGKSCLGNGSFWTCQ